ncbi:MAG: hypothetical protein PF443_00140, partial [Allgaiera sp.]|nr:hypothetical protein [Allgaiera sp.]
MTKTADQVTKPPEGARAPERAPERDRGRWPRRLGFALAIVAILSAIGVLMAEVVARMDSLQTAEADNLQWSLSQ